MLLCHSDALIHYIYINLLVCLSAFSRHFNRFDVDLSSGLRKFDGVSQQVDQHLHHAEPVNEIQLLSNFLGQEVEFNFSKLRFAAHNLDHLI